MTELQILRNKDMNDELDIDILTNEEYDLLDYDDFLDQLGYSIEERDKLLNSENFSVIKELYKEHMIGPAFSEPLDVNDIKEKIYVKIKKLG